MVVLCAGIMHRTLLLLPTPQKWQVVWGLFVIFVAQLHMCAVIFSPFIVFFVFCCWRCLSRCKLCRKRSKVPGPRSQPVSTLPSEAQGKKESSLCLFQLLAASTPLLVTTSLQALPLRSHCLFLFCLKSPSASLIRILGVAFRSHSDNPG